MKEIDDITGEIVDAAAKVHRGLGPGLLVSVYESVLTKALEKRGLKVARKSPYLLYTTTSLLMRDLESICWLMIA